MLLEARENLGRPQDADAAGGELNGQRQPIQASADLRDRRALSWVICKRRGTPPEPGDEEATASYCDSRSNPHGRQDSGTARRDARAPAFAVEMQCAPTGGQDLQPRRIAPKVAYYHGAAPSRCSKLSSSSRTFLDARCSLSSSMMGAGAPR